MREWVKEILQHAGKGNPTQGGLGDRVRRNYYQLSTVKEDSTQLSSNFPQISLKLPYRFRIRGLPHTTL